MATKKYLRVHTTEGGTWDSVTEALDQPQMDAIRDLLTDWQTMNYLKIDRPGGTPIYFNPANIVGVEVLETD